MICITRFQLANSRTIETVHVIILRIGGEGRLLYIAQKNDHYQSTFCTYSSAATVQCLYGLSISLLPLER
jgi:hypothetical protein